MTGRPFYFLVAALWLGNILPALDATLVGTSLPTVIGQLDGLALYSWVFAAYLLALTISIPISGKLADHFGRKPVYFFGVWLFIAGAVLSSLVQNVEQLIACRVLIAVATGFASPTIMTIMGDAIPMERRAKIQWVFASAWFVSSLVGPAVATAITTYLSWRFVPLVMVPIGLVAIYLLATRYEEHVEAQSHRIDYTGFALLGAGVLALLFALSPTNRTSGINLAESGGLLLVALVLIGLFVWNETRAAEPMLPPRLFVVPILAIASLGSLASGVAQSGATSFIPIFVQGGQGGSIADVGLVLAWMTIGWPIGAGLGGRFLLRMGFRPAVIGGMTAVLLASGGFLLLGRDSGTWVVAACMALLGLGFGVSTVAFTLSVQHSVGWRDRGVATASLQFFRSIGGSVGVAIMGAIMTSRMRPLLEESRVAGAASSASALLDPAARSAMAPDVLATLQLGMVDAVHLAFYVVAAAAAAGLVAVLWFPKTIGEAVEETAPDAGRAPVEQGRAVGR